MKHNLRLAEFKDIQEISRLIELSARKLGGEFYDEKTIEMALQGAFGVDTQLIKVKTYYVIETKNTIVACGGWSFRKTLFGSDTNNIRDPDKLNPRNQAAKIRAFFIHPEYARQGLGKCLLEECEGQAKFKGFSQCQLMSTLSGINFYQKNGYQGAQYIYHNIDESNQIKFLPMSKSL